MTCVVLHKRRGHNTACERDSMIHGTFRSDVFLSFQALDIVVCFVICETNRLKSQGYFLRFLAFSQEAGGAIDERYVRRICGHTVQVI